MADNTRLNPGSGGDDIATLDVSGVKHEKVIVEYLDGGGIPVMVSELAPLPVSATIDTTGLATSAKQDVGNSSLATIAAITQPLTDTQLRATPVPVSGTVTANTGLTQPLTDTQLRATPVPTSESAPTTVLNGVTNVTTAGTRVALAGSTTCKSVTIKALITNGGTIYVGSSTVSSANGFQLSAGDTISLDIANLSTVFIDSSVNGLSVSYIGVN